MTTKRDAVLDALVVSGLVAVNVGVFLILADYILVSAAVRLFEGWAVLPPGWGAAHAGTRQLAAVALAAVPTALVGWLMYRTARRSGDAR